jgi:hypothetical protein
VADILPLLGQLGGGGALVAVIIYLLGSNRADRKDAREAIAAAHERAKAAEARVEAANAMLDAALARARIAEAQLPAPPPPLLDPTAPPALPPVESP